MCCRVTSRNLVPSLQSKSHVPSRLSPNDEAASRKKQVQLDLRATCPPAPSRVATLLKSAWLSLSSKQRLPQRADRIQPCPLPTPPPAAQGPALHTPLGLHLHQEGRVKDRTGQTHRPSHFPSQRGHLHPVTLIITSHTRDHLQEAYRQVNPLHTNTCPVPRSSKD